MTANRRLARRCVLVALLLLAPWRSPVAADTGRYLPLNTWVALQPAATARVLPRDFVVCGNTGIRSNPVGRRASSVAYGGGIFYWGGGGQSHPGNDVEVFDIHGNAWMQQDTPECYPACCRTDPRCDVGCEPMSGVGTTAITPLGRPYPEKTFQLVAYNAHRGRYTLALTSGLWEWDAATREWTRLSADRPMSNDIATKMLVYDPDLQTVLYFATTTFHHTVFRFDYESNVWVEHGPIPTSIQWAQLFSAYDSNARKHLVAHGSGTYWIYDANDGSWVRLENVPADAVFRAEIDTNSMAFDPLADVFLLAKRTAASDAVELWTYRLATDTWTALAVNGGPPRRPATSYNGLVFDPLWRRFYFVDVRSVGGGGQGGSAEGDVQVWALRLGGPVGPGDGDCDERVTAADLLQVIAARSSFDPPDCGVLDANRDGVTDDADVPLVVPGIFATP